MNKLYLFVGCLLVLVINSCESTEKNEYQQRVKKELASGVKNDTLFLGYYFGMPQEDFFDHSWKLNKKNKIMNGEGAQILKAMNDLKANAKMVFYPNFKDGQIYQMPVEYSYNGWAPWNRHLWADSLKQDLAVYLEKQYEIKFFETNNPETGNFELVNISGNREIRISERTESKVLVLFTDLSKIELKF